MIYLTAPADAGKSSTATATAQNTSYIEIDETHTVLAEAWAEGHLPSIPSRAANVASPPAPGVSKIARAKVGFEAGTYIVTYTYIGPRGAETTLAPRLEVTLAAGQGLRITLPQQHPDNAVAMAIYVSAPGGTVATLQRQGYIDIISDPSTTVFLPGPWTGGKKPPGTNKTKKKRPKKPRVKKVKGKRKGKKGKYRATTAEVDRRGRETQGSELSSERNISEAEANKKVNIEVDFKDTSRNSNKRYNVYVHLDGESYKLNPDTRESVDRPVPAPRPSTKTRNQGRTFSRGTSDTGAGGMAGSMESLMESAAPGMLGAGSPKNQQTRQGGGSGGGGRGGGGGGRVGGRGGGGSRRRITTSGELDSTARRGERGVLRAGRSAPDKDLLVVDPPDSPFEAAAGEGPALLESPKEYRVAISFFMGDSESALSDFSPPIVLAVNETILVTLPDPMNLVRNPQMNKIDAEGKPLDWTLTGVGGSGVSEGSFRAREGILELDSIGAKTNTQVTPAAFNTFPVNREQVYTFGGVIASSVTAGAMKCDLEELGQDGTTVLATTELAYQSASGEIEFSKTFGDGQPNGFNSATASARIATRMVGIAGDTAITRNMIVSILELIANPHTRKLRRRVVAEEGAREPASTNVSSSVRLAKTAQKAVELPPSRQYQSLEIGGPIERVSFGDSVPETPATWNLRATGTVTTTAEAAAAIVGANGYHIQKTVASDARAYWWRTIGLPNRTQLGIRARFRMRQLPTLGWSSLVAAKTAQADAYSTNTLVTYAVNSAGQIFFFYLNSKGAWASSAAIATVRNGDVLDFETILQGAKGGIARLTSKIGINGGAISTINHGTGYRWSAQNPTVAQVGVQANSNPAALWNIDIDDIVISETGDTTASTISGPPPLHPLPSLDRPYSDPVPVTTLNVDDPPSIDSPWFSQEANANCDVAIHPDYRIDGGYGIRVSDSGSGELGHARVYYSYPTGQSSTAIRHRQHIVSRPSTGNTLISAISRTGGGWLAYAYLDLNGDLYVQAIPAVGSNPPPQQIAAGLANNTRFTLELIVQGAGTPSGSLSVRLTQGVESSLDDRRLYPQQTAIDWTNALVSTHYVGIVSESSAATIATYNIDSILVTERGEVSYRDYMPNGEEIYQAYAFYLPDQPIVDHHYLRGLEIAVRPNATYTAAIWARHANVAGRALPYFFTAYDSNGVAHPLGSLYGADEFGIENGATGTSAWALRKRTFVIPDDCVIVTMESFDMGGGEFVCQELSFSRGTEVISDRLFEPVGKARIVLDTETPDQYYVGAAFNKWLSTFAVIDDSSNTSFEILYGSGLSQQGPDNDEWTDNPDLVKQKKWAHYEITLNASLDRREAPTLPSGSPFVDYVRMIGNTQVSSLLREDESEFPGAVYLDGIQFPKQLSSYDVREPRGHTLRQRRHAPVGKLPPFRIYAFTRDAIEEIERTCMSEDFVIESRGYTMTVRFKTQLTFALKSGTIRQFGGVWYSWGEASTEEVEVLDNLQIEGLILS